MPSRWKCAVYNCNNSGRQSKKGEERALYFHTFPVKDPELTRIWIEKCKNYNLISVSSERGLGICSAHFTADDYVRDLEHELLNLPLRRRLKPGTIPSIFPDPDPDTSIPNGRLYIRHKT